MSQQDCRRWPDEACKPEVYETIDETDQIIGEEDSPETMKNVEAEDLGSSPGAPIPERLAIQDHVERLP